MPKTLTRRTFLSLVAASGAAAVLNACQPIVTPKPTAAITAEPYVTSTPTAMALIPPTRAMLPASWANLPRWRGFNLLEKYTLSGNQPYQEWDFDFAARNGFNFFRLPADYRIWTIVPGQYREAPLKEIDQAIHWGQARGIHTSLCLHRAPGYCVNPPEETLNLWADGDNGVEARRQFAEQWAMFAKRYQGIPSEALSFDLVNEPPNIAPAMYLRAIKAAVDAIRAVDPERLIIADGLSYGNQPVTELIPLQVAQSTRGYGPMQLSHYRANWINGSDRWPLPVWPVPTSANAYLYGDEKPDFRSPLVLNGNFASAAQLDITIQKVSNLADLAVRADGVVIFQKRFQPGSGTGEWKSAEYKPEWGIFQNTYDRVYSTTIPAGTHRVELSVDIGDWLTFSEIRIHPYTGSSSEELVIQPLDQDWGVKQDSYLVDPYGQLHSEKNRESIDRQVLWMKDVVPWVDLMGKGVGVHVGEWGVYSYTPHDVALAWMHDCLANWKQAGMGWALWNLRGSFGILDSGRTDVTYQQHEGHLLDRAMLDLLTQG